MPSDAGFVRNVDPAPGGAAVDQGARASQPPPTERVLTDAEVVDDMRRQLAERETRDQERDAELQRERTAREAEARRAADAEARARAAEDARQTSEHASRRSVEESRLDAIKNSLTTHEGQLNSLASTKANLVAEGKFEEAAKLDVEMAKVGGRIAQLEDGQAELEERIKNPPAPPAPAQVSDDERKEGFIRQQPPLVQQWLRSAEGSRFFSDAQFRDDVAAAARLAQRRHSIDSQDYIDYVREAVGLQRQQADDPPRRDERVPSRPGQGRDVGRDDGSRLVAAPPGGAVGGSVRRNNDGSTDVYLSAGEREQADRMGVSHADWARNKRDLLNEGLIGPGARR